MPKYWVSVEVYATIEIEVEAESEQEAKRKAQERAEEPTLCDRCGDEVDIGGVGNAIRATLKKEK